MSDEHRHTSMVKTPIPSYKLLTPGTLLCSLHERGSEHPSCWRIIRAARCPTAIQRRSVCCSCCRRALRVEDANIPMLGGARDAEVQREINDNVRDDLKAWHSPAFAATTTTTAAAASAAAVVGCDRCGCGEGEHIHGKCLAECRQRHEQRLDTRRVCVVMQLERLRYAAVARRRHAAVGGLPRGGIREGGSELQPPLPLRAREGLRFEMEVPYCLRPAASAPSVPPRRRQPTYLSHRAGDRAHSDDVLFLCAFL